MAQPTPLPSALARRAFSVREARDLGVGEGRLRGRDLSRPLWGVRHPGPVDPLLDRVRVAAAALPGDVAFSHVTAARLHSLPLPDRWQTTEQLHVMRATDQPRVRHQPIRHHKGLESRRVVVQHGIRLVGASDTWADLAVELELDELVVLGDAVTHFRKGIPLDQLKSVVARRAGGRGATRMRQSLDLIRPRSNSPMETRARLLFLRGGLPEPALNMVINDRQSGQWLSESDFVWREQRVVAEFDGDQHRTDRGQWQNDIARRENLQDDGWHFVQLTHKSVVSRPHAHHTVSRLAQLLGVTPSPLSSPAPRPLSVGRRSVT